MPHLVHEREQSHNLVGAPVLHELGGNFSITGIVEHPKFFAKDASSPFGCLTCVRQSFNLTAALNCGQMTDGSVLRVHQCFNMFQPTAAYAIVDSDKVQKKGTVNRLQLNALSPSSLYPDSISGPYFQ